MARKYAQLYTKSKYAYRNGRFQYVYGKNETLFSNRKYPTKITADLLPEWYVEGFYYKHPGYLSAKGVKHLLYVPDKFFNHMFKDDCLFVSYDKPIIEDLNRELYHERYTGFDQCIYGRTIISFLKAAEQYSGYDITGIKAQIEDKRLWFKTKYPDFYALEVPEDKPFFP